MALDTKHQANHHYTMGDTFGEISMVYGCKRTVNITSENFTTLGRLTREQYQLCLAQFPTLSSLLKQKIFSYRDRKKMFMLKCINKIDFFKGLGNDA